MSDESVGKKLWWVLMLITIAWLIYWIGNGVIEIHQ